MSETTKPNPTAYTAAQRRWLFGIMLSVVVIAAIGTVVIANYLVYWQYRSMSPEARDWVRYDLTATRKYSLSDQSQGVISGLDQPHRMVTMLGGEAMSDEQRQRIRDLADEYGRASTQLEVEHIDLDTQAKRRAELLASMDAMFADDTESIRGSIAQGLDLVERYAAVINKVQALLQPIADDSDKLFSSSVQRQRLADLNSQYLRLQEQAKALRTKRDNMLGTAWQNRLNTPGETTTTDADRGDDMPDYTALMGGIQDYVAALAAALSDTPRKSDQLRRSVVSNALAPAEDQRPALEAQNTFAYLLDQVPQLISQARVQTQPLLAVPLPLRYEAARSILNDKPCVLITAGGDARVLPADLLFRGAGTSATAQTSDLFVGEEQLTGALVSMSLDPPPLVVFVRSNIGLRALSAAGSDELRLDGLYDYVATRLLAMDFEVAEWANPLKDEPPIVREGQRVVWVTMPYLKPDTARKESLDSARKDKVASFLAQRLDAGDAALFMLSFNPDADPKLTTGKDADSLVTLLQTFGIDAQLYHSAARLSIENEDAAQSIYSDEFLVTAWPESAIVGKALDGIDTYFKAPMPLKLSPVDGVKQTPLAQLTTAAMHVQRDAPDPKTGLFTPASDSQREQVLIGAAAQAGDARLVAIGEATWAIDDVTTAAILPDGSAGPNLADRPGARLAQPGNTDLFVNCICWLAHEDELIAASPRVQDVRRVEAMSGNTLGFYRVVLLGGMPGLILIIGIGVWLMRLRA